MPQRPEFLKRGQPVRLQAFLSRSGLSSRRGAEEMIEAGRVAVNGQTVTAMGITVKPGVDRIEVDGEEVRVAPVTWIALNKPEGYVTSRTDPFGRRTVYDLLPERYHGLFHVGRLDRDSEGIILFTNDGPLANRLLHPSHGVTKEYEVVAAGKPSDAALRQLVEGVELEDGIASAESAKLLGPAGNGLSRLRLVLREGKKREVRRMLDAIGHPVRKLVRQRFGPITLAELPSGRHRMVAEEELASVRADAPRRRGAPRAAEPSPERKARAAAKPAAPRTTERPAAKPAPRAAKAVRDETAERGPARKPRGPGSAPARREVTKRLRDEARPDPAAEGKPGTERSAAKRRPAKRDDRPGRPAPRGARPGPARGGVASKGKRDEAPPPRRSAVREDREDEVERTPSRGGRGGPRPARGARPGRPQGGAAGGPRRDGAAPKRSPDADERGGDAPRTRDDRGDAPPPRKRGFRTRPAPHADRDPVVPRDGDRAGDRPDRGERGAKKPSGGRGPGKGPARGGPKGPSRGPGRGPGKPGGGRPRR